MREEYRREDKELGEVEREVNRLRNVNEDMKHEMEELKTRVQSQN